MPLGGADHAELVTGGHAVEVIHFADDGFEADVAFVDEFVPVEGVDDFEVAFAEFDEFLLEFALDAADAPGFEGGEVLGDDSGGESRGGVGQEGGALFAGFQGGVDGVNGS